MLRVSLLALVVGAMLAWPTTGLAQSPGTYRLLTVGTSGGEEGFGGTGTVTIRSNKSVVVKIKDPDDPSIVTTYTGRATKNPFTVNGPEDRKFRIRINYRGTKYAYGTYTALEGTEVVGAGVYSMTRR